jgi:2-dehydropantoate 2-reductase
MAPLSSDDKILVVGPGALGSLFAVRLARRWPGVYLLDHRPERAARLQEDGLHVTGVTLGDWTPPPNRVRADTRGWPVMDVVMFFVKAPGFPAALRASRPVTGPRTALLIFPEAVDSRTAQGSSRRVVAALTEDRARVEGPGRVVHEARGNTYLDASAPGASESAALFKGASIPVVLDRKLGDRRWKTLLAQVCMDLPTALTDTVQKDLLVPPLRGLGDRLLEECAAVAKALRRPIPCGVLRARRDDLIRQAPDAKSPLGRDLLRGRPTERAALLDPLLAAAKKARVHTPFLSAMDRLLRSLEKEPRA